ncbi:MAG: hypothetical protein AAF581_00265 [Planctomycetota bacterium]
MNQISTAILFAVVLLAAAVGFYASQRLRDDSTDEVAVIDYAAQNAASIEQLSLRLAVLEQQLTPESLQGHGDARIDDAALAARIQALVAEQLTQQIDAAKSADEKANGNLDLAMLIADLYDPRLSATERAELWQEIRDGKQVDAVLTELEQRAASAPNDARARTELGLGYFQKMQTTSGGPETGRWGARGAKTLSEALQLDDRDWEARFALAQHYFYAEMRGDAIHHLKILVQQQSQRVPEDRHANAYLLLGNIYMDRGKEAEAKQIWRDAAALFPQNHTVQQRLEKFE